MLEDLVRRPIVVLHEVGVLGIFAFRNREELYPILPREASFRELKFGDRFPFQHSRSLGLGVWVSWGLVHLDEVAGQ